MWFVRWWYEIFVNRSPEFEFMAGCRNHYFPNHRIKKGQSKWARMRHFCNRACYIRNGLSLPCTSGRYCIQSSRPPPKWKRTRFFLEQGRWSWRYILRGAWNTNRENRKSQTSSGIGGPGSGNADEWQISKWGRQRWLRGEWKSKRSRWGHRMYDACRELCYRAEWLEWEWCWRLLSRRLG